ncbi:MAG TPA: FtsX-like permease family protein, partial [Puia sp.]|nr:FtsX-like permease family protein [Puia sp.]
MGRNFSSQLPTDSQCMLINETAARVLGYVNPIGQQLYTYGDSAGLRVIGVVRDFNTGSLHNPIDPVVFELRRDGGAITIRLSPGDVKGTLRAIERQYRAIVNGYPFDYAFLDDDFNRLYHDDQRTGDLFSIFAGLAIVVAAIGMFGLVAAAAEQRTKEMGIRRVLGAGMVDITLLLFKSYAFAIGMAVLVALPVGAFVMSRWLEGFAYRTSLQAWMFLFAPICALVLVILIVGTKAWRATRVSPSRTLRVE